VSLVEQELPTLSEHVRSLGFSGGASAARFLKTLECRTNREIYNPYADASGMFQQINKESSQWEN
jgi:dissimilatory sulfite reductase (desulfoviridin) alpha/beta subunit